MTNSSPSSSEASGFTRLHPSIQRWVWSKGWTSLRDAQERAIAPILQGEHDIIIAAATAAGKTEAAFLPILTKLVEAGEDALAVYVSPLKALINDQWGRLDQLCEALEVPVIPWHGDISSSKKQRFLKRPGGVLLITPESLEAMFVLRGNDIPRLFANACYIVVDEVHAFIGTDRGKQMQSLLHRLELRASARIPRVGLSATLGDMSEAARFLRPNDASSVELITSGSSKQELRLQVRGYVVASQKEPEPDVSVDEEDVFGAEQAVADHLYATLRGSNNLIFPNSRKKVEFYADALRRRCEADGVPSEFWPHHGSLARSIREETERALKQGDRPATAICTTTLELGIDIGAIKSVAQIGPGPSVASLRQRLGRSGRREGEPAILRSYNIEDRLTAKSPLSDRLRESLVQSIAMIRLLMQGWFEPPNSHGLHLSTLVQQVLSAIAEHSGAQAAELYQWLVVKGAFGDVTSAEFVELLRSMAAKGLIMQEGSGLLLPAEAGERFLASHDFYAAFSSEEEWQIVSQGQAMGSLPISSPIFEGMRLIFAGRRWRVLGVDQDAMIVNVVADHGGAPPLFGGGRANVHDRVRREMRIALEESAAVPFLDKCASVLLAEARQHYGELSLAENPRVVAGDITALFTWSGDAANDALVLLLRGLGIEHVENEGLYLAASKVNADRLYDALSDISALTDADYMTLLDDVYNMRQGKWDWVLSDSLLRKSFASTHLSLSEARMIARELVAHW